MRKEIQGRILIIAFLGDPTLPAGILSTGGFNQTLSELVEYLATLPYYFTIITDVSAYATTPSEEISSNIELYRVYLSADEHRNQDLLRDATPRILIECKKIISDALHEYFLIHSFYWFSGNVAHYISQETHIPFIHTPISLAFEKIANGITPKSVWQLPCETQFLKTAEYILAITEAERDVLIKHYMTSRTKIIVVGRSVNEIFRFPVRDRSGVPRTLYEQRRNFTTNSNCFDAHWWSPMAFTYLGRLEAVKGVDHIIRAWCSLYPKYHETIPPLWIIGGSPELIQDLRIGLGRDIDKLCQAEDEKKIIWWGYLDAASISTIFLKTLALITHSKAESGGRVMLEAMCQGVPVIATPHGFALDHITNWHNGFLVEFGDINALAQRMEHFINQPLLSSVMGNSAKGYYSYMEHNWNYFGIHRTIYSAFYNRETPSIGSMGTLTLQNQNKNVLSYQLNEFPYCLANIDERAVAEACEEFPAKFSEIEQIMDSDSSRILKIRTREDGNYYFKQFSSVMSDLAIWDPFENKKAIHANERFTLAKQSCSFRDIVDLKYSCQELCFYALPEYPAPIDLPVSLIEKIFRKFSTLSMQKCKAVDELISRLENETLNGTAEWDKYKSLFSVTTIKPYSLNSAIKHLIDIFQYTRLQDLSILLRLENIHKSEEETRSNRIFGLNYGKTLCAHLIQVADDYRLLPSADWYYGEIGLDVVRTVYGQSSMPMEATAISQYDWQLFDRDRLLLWQVYFAAERYIRSSIMRTPDLSENKIFLQCSLDVAENVLYLE